MSGKALEHITKGFPVAGALVVLRGKDGKIAAIVKLGAIKGHNALGWPVFPVSLVHGMTVLLELAVPTGEKVELCLSVLSRTEEPEPEAKPLFRPFHAYVESGENTNAYYVYKFLRKAMAHKVVGCAKRFGLQSFIITQLD